MGNRWQISYPDKVKGVGLMQTDKRRTFAACSPHQSGRKDGARAMTPKERIKVHAEIERENRRKLEEFKKGGKAA